MALFPNLHTMQLNFNCNPSHSRTLKQLLLGHNFPQIRTLCVSLTADPFVAVCPKLRQLVPYRGAHNEWDDFGTETAQSCPELEVLGLLRLDSSPITRVKGSSSIIYTRVSVN